MKLFIPFYTGSSKPIRTALLVLSALTSTVAGAQTTFKNDSVLYIPDGEQVPISGIPYPSTIQVSNIKGIISDLTITLYNYQHNNPDAVDMLLVAPDGTNAIILSDVGGAVDIKGIDVILDDSASVPLPDFQTFGSGTYKPTNMGFGEDKWPSPSPVASGNHSLSGFYGIDPNGTWKLYVVSDVDGGYGYISGGWSLTITTVNAAQPTSFENVDGRYDKEKKQIAISWSTAYEYNTSSFTIERARNGSGWIPIDTVPAAGFSTAGQQYVRTDANVVSGNYLYRIKLTTKDGSVKYSNVISVVVANNITLTLFPNPATNYTYIQSDSDKPAVFDIYLYDSNNNLQLQKKGTISESSAMRLDFNLPPGTYYVKMMNGDTQSTKTLKIIN